jgi:hypothetical protein
MLLAMGKLSAIVHKRPRVLISAIVVLVLVVAFVLAVHNLNAPAVGDITQPPPSKLEKTDPYADPGTYKGKLISFTYPAHYKIVPSQKTGNILDVIYLYATDQSSKSISVGVVKENISDDSGIALRRHQPDKYKEMPRSRTGVIEFTSTVNGSEITAYVPHQDLVASFSITAPPNWDLTADMNTMLGSLKWK